MPSDPASLVRRDRRRADADRDAPDVAADTARRALRHIHAWGADGVRTSWHQSLPPSIRPTGLRLRGSSHERIRVIRRSRKPLWVRPRWVRGRRGSLSAVVSRETFRVTKTSCSDPAGDGQPRRIRPGSVRDCSVVCCARPEVHRLCSTGPRPRGCAHLRWCTSGAHRRGQVRLPEDSPGWVNVLVKATFRPSPQVPRSASIVHALLRHLSRQVADLGFCGSAGRSFRLCSVRAAVSSGRAWFVWRPDGS